jgi:hypothetical protein
VEVFRCARIRGRGQSRLEARTHPRATTGNWRAAANAMKGALGENRDARPFNRSTRTRQVLEPGSILQTRTLAGRYQREKD